MARLSFGSISSRCRINPVKVSVLFYSAVVVQMFISIKPFVLTAAA